MGANTEVSSRMSKKRMAPGHQHVGDIKVTDSEERGQRRGEGSQAGC